MRPTIAAAVVLAIAGAVYGIPGDLDLDGDVDFDDFFTFADNFGKTGAPDTLRVTVFDTLSIETVYDTVTVEFVAAPDSIRSNDPDRLIYDSSTGEPIAMLDLDMDWRSGYIRQYYREPIDEDDHPLIYVDYDEVPVAASFLLRYSAFVVDDSLVVSTPDTLSLLREVRLLQGAGYGYSYYFEDALEMLRFPEVANTAGDFIFDVVFRTPEQGDFAARGAIPVTVSSTGKILLH